ncbi:hypothetical protein CMUS01_09647 [Colletotrichum musicola]|uniref:Uncharacterized protein n=1 Tax=Colletotrichum musicola TaxID=2175873 RepID=A0A8H6K730_9PEZI|nr:hypothetical protein CMUS01_09647 [Colletotrichum musicola]
MAASKTQSATHQTPIRQSGWLVTSGLKAKRSSFRLSQSLRLPPIPQTAVVAPTRKADVLASTMALAVVCALSPRPPRWIPGDRALPTEEFYSETTPKGPNVTAIITDVQHDLGKRHAC